MFKKIINYIKNNSFKSIFLFSIFTAISLYLFISSNKNADLGHEIILPLILGFIGGSLLNLLLFIPMFSVNNNFLYEPIFILSFFFNIISIIIIIYEFIKYKRKKNISKIELILLYLSLVYWYCSGSFITLFIFNYQGL